MAGDAAGTGGKEEGHADVVTLLLALPRSLLRGLRAAASDVCCMGRLLALIAALVAAVWCPRRWTGGLAADAVPTFAAMLEAAPSRRCVHSTTSEGEEEEEGGGRWGGEEDGHSARLVTISLDPAPCEGRGAPVSSPFRTVMAPPRPHAGGHTPPCAGVGGTGAHGFRAAQPASC